MSDPLRIISVEPSGAGGIAHYTRFLDEALAIDGTHIDLLTANRWIYELPPNARIHKVFNRKRTNPFQLYLLSKRLQKSAQLVHWQSASHPNMLLWLMRLIPLKKLPWVYTVHNVLPHENSTSMLSLYQKIYEKMDALIFHNQHSIDQFHKLFPTIQAKKTVIPHGEYGTLGSVDLSEEYPETPTILFFGNIRPYKGLKHLIQAFPQIQEKIPNAKLHIAGQPLENFSLYQQLLEELKITDSVTCTLDYLPDEEIPTVFRDASVVVLPYEHIDQSGVLLLAMGMGRAVVASAVGGLPEVINDGKTGVLVEPKNPEALADAVSTLLSDHDALRTMGKAAAQDVNTRFAWDTIAKSTVKYYHEVLDIK